MKTPLKILPTTLTLIITICLVYMAIGQILNQEALTAHLVENGMFNWRFSRLLVFVLPGIELMLALTLGLKLNGSKLLQYLTLIIAVLLTWDFWASYSIEILPIKRQLWMEPIAHNTLAYPMRDSLITLFSIELFVCLILLISSIWYLFIKKNYKIVPLYIYFITVLLIPISMLDTPLYITDFYGEQSDMPKDMSLEKLETILPKDLPDDYAVYFLSASCETCLEASRRLGILARGGNHIPIYLVFRSQESTIDLFLKKTHNMSLPHINLTGSQEIHHYSEGAPGVYRVTNGKITDHRKGHFINYWFLDRLRP